MNTSVNRVATALGEWRLREQRLGQLFSLDPAQSKALLSERLKNYERISAKFKYTESTEEDIALRMLKQERKQIERKLYPNFFVRLLRRLFIAPIIEQVVMHNDRQSTHQNTSALQLQVQRTGFTGLSEQMAKKMHEGHQQFNLPVSYYLNDKERLEHQLSFAKNEAGRYCFEGFSTAIVYEGRELEKRQHFFDTQAGMEINTAEAYNLLSGRSIEKDGKWLQFDLHDKDAQGNYRMKEFHERYGYDLEKDLKQLPLTESADSIKVAKLCEDLKQGGRQSVTFVKEGRELQYYIEANPQFRTFTIYDEHSRKITLATATGAKTLEALKLAKKTDERQEESEVKRKGMRVIY